jgi:D-glycero-D-manno-heptose 1,7-bisphosphate phosphatase
VTEAAASRSRSKQGYAALFLDRDGVINVDHGYAHRIERFDFLAGIFELARFWTNEMRGPLVVVTNQSGIGRGYFNERAHYDLTQWMCARFEVEASKIAAVYHCPFHPVHGIGPYRRDHPWRKPNPGMFLQAGRDLGLDLPRSVLIGDRMADMEAGAAAGLGLLVLIGPRASGDAPGSPSHIPVPDLAAALALLRRRCA